MRDVSGNVYEGREDYIEINRINIEIIKRNNIETIKINNQDIILFIFILKKDLSPLENKLRSSHSCNLEGIKSS